MNVINLKKEIEEKEIALEELIKQCEKEEKKLFLFKSEKKINELKERIASLDEEIAKLEKTYNSQLKLKKAAGNATDNLTSFTKKHGLKAGVGFAAAFAVFLGYMSNKPLIVNGEKTTYRSMIESYENTEVSSADYTPETYEQYMHNLEDAEAQKSDIFMSDEDKLTYIASVLSAYDALEPIPDKTALSSALNEAGKYDTSAYTPASVKEFKSAVSQVKAVYDDPNATKKEVTAAQTDIASAYHKLTMKADKSELTELYNEYADYGLEDYTPSSVQNFNKEIQNTKKVIDDENASQDTVDKQIQAIQSIETLLVKKADKSSLQSLIDECNGLNGDDYKSGYDELVSQLKTSTGILNDGNASQEEVDLSVSDLQSAKSGLVEYTIRVYRVNMNAIIQSNNSVGSDWSYARYCNGGSVHDGFEITDEYGNYASVGMQITENDSIPDIGYGSASIYLQDGYETSFNVTVVENRGRYYGNIAEFTVNVSVKLIRRE